jgi:hypothetical protein
MTRKIWFAQGMRGYAVGEGDQEIGWAASRADAAMFATSPGLVDFVRRIVEEQKALGELGDAQIIRAGTELLDKSEGK